MALFSQSTSDPFCEMELTGIEPLVNELFKDTPFSFSDIL